MTVPGRRERVKSASVDRCDAVLADCLTELPIRPTTLCDVGSKDGRKTLVWAAAAGVAHDACVGIEVNEEYVGKAKVPTHKIDLEIEPLPLLDGAVDLVVAQQVLEHLKNVHHVLAEMNRVLVPGGVLAVGSPNLASAHNRLLLVLGRQPTSIRTVSQHVRGFTRDELARLLQLFGFRIIGSRGAGFYPFLSGRVLAALDRLLPGAAVYQCHVCVKARRTPDSAIRAFAFRDTNYRPGEAG